MIQILNNIAGRENVSDAMKRFNFISFLLMAVSLLGMPICVMVKVSRILVYILLIYIILLFLGCIFVNRTGKLKLGLYLVVYLTNMLVLPAFFLLGGGLYGGVPFLFVVGYVLTFTLLDGAALFLAAFIVSMWYAFLMAYSYYYPDNVAYITDKAAFRADMLFCYFLVIVISSVELLMNSGAYKKFRKSFEESKKISEETGAVKSRFLTSMSSELRMPMNTIINMSELLEKEEDNTTVAYELSMIRESAFSLMEMINNILNYSQIDTGKMRLYPRQFSFAKLMRDLIYTVSLETQQKGLNFTTDIDPMIPDIMYADDQRIRDVFQYIISNSIKSTDEGRISMDISFKNNEKSKSVNIFVRISDTGEGFTADEKESIFSSFEIYDSRKYSRLKKTGLEMTICRDILNMMNGKIAIDSIDGVGSQISFDFEVFVAADAHIVDCERLSNKKALVMVEKHSREAVWADHFGNFGIAPDFIYTKNVLESKIMEKSFDFVCISDYSYESVSDIISKYNLEENTYVVTNYDHVFGDFGKCRILRRPVSCLNLSEAVLNTWKEEDYVDLSGGKQYIAPDAQVLVVDDSMLNIKVIMQLMQRYQISPAVATSGKEALEKCGRENFDIILLDQEMPGLDGAQTLRYLRQSDNENNKNVPVICLASSMIDEVREDIMRDGYTDYMIKPIKQRSLGDILKNYLPSDRIKYVDEEKSKEDTSEKFPPGLTSQAGLDRTGGDMATYCAILNTFYREGHQKIEDIMNQYQSQDIKNFTINVHAVKSSAASIGGLEVSELHRQLEMAGKSSDLEFIDAHVDNAIEKYRLLLEDIYEYLVKEGMYEEETGVDASAEVEEFDIEQMKQFRMQVENFETDAFEALAKTWEGRNFGDEMNSYIKVIHKSIADFDYDTALEMADEFIEVFDS